MTALSKLSHVYVKISYLCYTDKENFDQRDGRVHEMVKEVLRLFGPERCMFASNYPVDLKDGVPPARLYDSFLMFAEGFTDEQKQMLFGGTAKKAYNCA